MQQVKVDHIHLEPHEAALAGDDGAAPRGIVRQHLADQEHRVAAPLDRLADQLLGAAVRIHLRRIDQGHAEIDAEAQCRDFVRAPAEIFGHVPSALPENRDFLARRRVVVRTR